MKKLLLILTLLPCLLFGQVLKYNATYNLGNYCIAGNSSNNMVNCGVSASAKTKITINIDIFRTDATKRAAVGQGDDLNNRWHLFLNNDGKIYFTLCNGSTAYGYVNSSIYGWNNFHIVYDGSQADNPGRIKMWINGVAQTLSFSGTIPAVMPTVTDNIAICRLRGSNVSYSYYDGRFSNFQYIADLAVAYADLAAATKTVYQPLASGYNTVAYDVTGNGTHGTISGTNYWSTSTQTSYNETNGCTYVTYGNNTVLVPYLLAGTELYTSVDPVLNAAEKTREFPASYWLTDYFITTASKILKQ